MTLPTTNIPWPPSAYDPVGHQLKLWSAWFSGDHDQLSWAYFNLGANSPLGRSFFRSTGEAQIPQPRPGQFRGGLLGAITRMFWGQPIPPGEKRTKIHVPIAGDLSSMSADLLFAKRPTFTDPGDPDGTGANQLWFDDRFDDDLHATLLESAEVCSALGGVYLRVAYDTSISDCAWLEPVHPDAAVPEFSHGKLTSVTFWRVIADNGTDVVRQLEKHVPADNSIFHGVYVGTQTDLGMPAPLTDFPETAPLAPLLVDGQAIVFPDLPGDASTVSYIPNMRPNRIWRDIPVATSLGRSDYCGVESLMDALDETYSSWMRDIRLAKSRLIVPPSYLDNIGPGRGAVMEPDREVFVPLNMLAGGQAEQITANQFAIRFQEHQATCQELITQIIERAGFAQASFGEAATTAMTATEVENRERRTLLLRAKKLNYWRPGLAGAIYGQMAVEEQVFGRGLTPVRPDVTFPDAILPSLQELATTAVALENAHAASIETLVTLVHPDWTVDQVDEEVAAIKGELGINVLERARVTLAPPQGSTATVAQDVEQIITDVSTPTDSNLIGVAGGSEIY